MYGEDIKAVQNKLNSLGYNCGTADGYYGNATKSAVISFQSAKGLTADGEVVLLLGMLYLALLQLLLEVAILDY